MTETQRIVERMKAAKRLDDFWQVAHEELARFGVSGILYGQLASSKETVGSARYHDLPVPRGLLTKTSYSASFLSAFDNNSLIENDPTVTHCLLNSDVLVWSYNEAWAEHHPWYHARYEMERDLGYHKGCSIPSRYFSDGWIGGMGVAMTEVPDQEFPRFWQFNHQRILDICGLLELGMRQEHSTEFLALTPREKECLTWLAAGFTPSEIAERMQIGPKRVEKIVAQCKAKLKARTRDHAVARALLLGAIEP